jgi:predicted porin
MKRQGRATLGATQLLLGLGTMAVAAPAIAQSGASGAASGVSVYGVIDSAVDVARNGGSGGSTVRVQPSVGLASRFGIRGAESLGAGLRAVFALELGFNTDTGGLLSYAGDPGFRGAAPIPAGNGFGRRSYVGLEGAFGSLTFGRDYTPFFWAHIGTSAVGYSYYGNTQNFYDFTGTGPERSARASNAVFYATPSLGGVTARAMYSAGAESGGGTGEAPKSANRMWGASIVYAQRGLTLAAAYQSLSLPVIGGTVAVPAFTGATSDRKDWVIGARHNFGAFSLAAGHARSDPEGADNTGRQSWLGGTVKVGTGTAALQVQRVDRGVATGTKPRGNVMSVSYAYPFSRRTTGYVTYGTVHNNGTGAFRLYAAATNTAPAAVGADVSAFAIGLTHSF